MQTRFDRELYRNRVQVETVVSMIKRRQGSHVRGHKYWSQSRDLRLKALVHNVMILMLIEVFYRAGQVSFTELPRPRSVPSSPNRTEPKDVKPQPRSIDPN